MSVAVARSSTEGDSSRRGALSTEPSGGQAMSAFYWILAVVNVSNGLWMIADPAGWFTGIPAAVPDTGPFNPHLVRDVGVTYTVCGIGLAWCALHLEHALAVNVGVVAFNVGHALTHVADIVAGRLPPSHWLIDMPGVFAPTIAMIVALVMLSRRQRT
jgi:hypothetical protein